MRGLFHIIGILALFVSSHATAQLTAETAGDLELLATIHHTAPKTQDSAVKKYPAPPLETRNAEGLWTEHAKVKHYIDTELQQIKSLPDTEKQATLKTLKTRITQILDDNLTALSTPDDIYKNIGFPSTHIHAKKQSLIETNAYLRQTLNHIKTL